MNNRILPVHILRLYAWESLKTNTWLETADYNGYIPIIPIEDEPILADMKKTYMIYGYSENEKNSVQIQTGTFAIRIIARTFAELGEVTNVLSMAFDGEDAAAERVNNFKELNSAFDGIRFVYIRPTYIEGGTPGNSEGAPVEGLINIECRYISHKEIYLPGGGTGLWLVKNIERQSHDALTVSVSEVSTKA